VILIRTLFGIRGLFYSCLQKFRNCCLFRFCHSVVSIDRYPRSVIPTRCVRLADVKKLSVLACLFLCASACGGTSETVAPISTVAPTTTSAPTVAPTPTTTVAPTTTLTPTTTVASSTTSITIQPYFQFSKLVKVTPDSEINIPGAFCRIHHRKQTEDLIVTFGGAGRQGIFEQGHGYKAYTKKLEEKDDFAIFYPFGGDAASLLIDDILYFATGSPTGWRLLKFDAISWEKLSETDYPIERDYELENDNMLAFFDGLLDVSGLHVPEGSAAHRTGTLQSGPLESRLIDHDRGYSTHHRFFTTDLDFVEYKVLKDAPQFFGTSMLELGDSIYLITSDSFLGKLTALRYDKEWKYLETIDLGISGTWPQGVVFDPVKDRIHLAYEGGEKGFRNIRLATFDATWNLIEEMSVTDYTFEENKVVSRPWLLMLGGTLYVSFDVMSVAGNQREGVLDNECWIKSFTNGTVDTTTTTAESTAANESIVTAEVTESDPKLEELADTPVIERSESITDSKIFPSSSTPSTMGKPTFTPALVDQYEVTAINDIEFTQAAKQDGKSIPLHLNLCLPDTSGLGPRPLLIHIHGGGFNTGNRASCDTQNGNIYYERRGVQEFAARGWVVASIDYRLSTDAPSPGPRVEGLMDAVGGPGASALFRSFVAAVEDTISALEYLLGRADELEIDTSRIVLKGESAGAFASLAVAYCSDRYEITRPSIAAVISISGALTHSCGNGDVIDADEPMLFIAHGTEDRGQTHFSNAQNLEKNAIAAGITYEFHPLDGIGHGFDQWEVQTTGERSVAEAFFDFMDRVLFN